MCALLTRIQCKISVTQVTLNACGPLVIFFSIMRNYNNGAVDMQMCALLTRIQCKVSDTQVTVKACGPLAIILGHLSHSGDLLSWVDVRRRALCVVRRASSVNIFFSKTTVPILTKFGM